MSLTIGKIIDKKMVNETDENPSDEVKSRSLPEIQVKIKGTRKKLRVKGLTFQDEAHGASEEGGTQRPYGRKEQLLLIVVAGQVEHDQFRVRRHRPHRLIHRLA